MMKDVEVERLLEAEKEYVVVEREEAVIARN